MDGIKVPLALETYQPSDDPIQVLQTGKHRITRRGYYSPVQTSAGLTPTTGPKEVSAFGSTTFSGSSSTLHVEYEDDVIPFVVATGLFATAWTIMREFRQGRTITWTSTDIYVALLLDMYDDMYQGLLDEEPMYLDEDFDTASNLTEVIEGLNWKDDTLGTDDMYWTKLRIWFYCKGLQWSAKLPSLCGRLDQSTQGEEIQKQQVVMFLCYSAAELYFLWPLAMLQTDYSRIVLASEAYDKVKKKVGGEGFEATYHAIWSKLAEPTKSSLITDMDGLSAYTEYLADWLDVTLIKSSTFQELLTDIHSQYMVPTLPLNIVQSQIGIGIYHETVHFSNEWFGALPTSSGTHDNHSLASPMVGVETVLALKILDGTVGWWKDFSAAVKEQKHWTHSDMEHILDGFATPFNMVKSLHGFCDSQAYYGPRAFFRFTDSGLVQTAEKVTDPQNLHSSNTLVITVAGFEANDYILPMLGKYIPKWYTLYYTGNVDMDIIKSRQFWGFLCGLTSSTSWQDQRFTMEQIDLVSMIDAKSNNIDDIKALAYSTTEQKRFEHVKDPLDMTNNKVIALKYVAGLSKPSFAYDQTLIEPRPWDNDHYTSRIQQIGQPTVLRDLGRNMFNYGGSTSTPSTSSNPSPPTPDIPTENSAEAGNEDME